MTKPWDEAMKKMVAASPQEVVDWLVPGGQFVELLSNELPKDKEEPLRADICVAITIKEKPWVILIEVQSRADPRIAERLLEYKLRIKRIDPQHRPVYGCVLYVGNVGTVAQLPFTELDPFDEEMTRYRYRSIELANMDPKDLLELGQPGILPLLPLTKGGATTQMAETMFTELQTANRTELIAIGMLLASLSFGKENTEGQEWLIRKETQMYDILEETPLFQRWTKRALEEGREEGREEGLEKGLEKGRKEGRQEKLDTLRETLLKVVEARFPKVVRLAKWQAISIDDAETLENLIVNVSIAQDAKEARRYLLEEDEDDEV